MDASEQVKPADEGRLQRGVRRVVCAAVLYGNEVMLVGPRHFDATMRDQMRRFGVQWNAPHVEGFIDQWGNFMNREEAHKVASEQGQIRHRCGGDSGRLFSENLY
jgi:ferredoxin-NADP reductase